MNETLEEKLARLNAAAQQRIDAKKAERRQKWQRVQTESPDMAQWLTHMREEFGDTTVVSLTLNGERII